MGVRIDLRYDGALQCQAVHEPSGDTLSTDAPKDNHGQGLHFSPTDLLATSLGACMLTTMGIAARAHALDITGSTAEVEKHMGATPRRHVARLSVKISVPATVPDAQREVLQTAAATCPVASSLAPATVIDLLFAYV